MTTGRQRTVIAAVVGVGLAAALSACADTESAGGADAELRPFKSAIFPGETYALDYIADEKGFFEENGLEVDYLSPQSGAAAVQMIAAGQIQGWSTAPAIIYNAAAQGQPVQLGGLINGYTAYEVIVQSDADWADPDQSYEEKVRSLEGKTIGVSGLNAGTDLSLLAALDSVGLSAKDVERIGVGTTLSGLGQLKAGSIDAYVEFTGSGSRLIENSGAGKRFLELHGEDVPDEVDALSDLAIAVNSGWAAENRETVDDWLASLNEAREWLEDPANLDEATEIIANASYNGENQEEVRSSLEALSAKLSNTEPGFEATTERVGVQIDALKTIGALQPNADVSASSVTLD